jgi:hypothetical protein
MPCHCERPDSLHRILQRHSLKDLDTLQDFQDVRKIEDVHDCENAEDIDGCEDVEALQVCLGLNYNLGHKELILRLLSCVNMR